MQLFTPPHFSGALDDDVEEDAEILEEENDSNEYDSDINENDLIEVSLDELEARLNHDHDINDETILAAPEDMATITFTRHSDAVFGCTLHPYDDVAVTGGQDDKVFIWNTTTGDVIYEINEHTDTVTDVHFSHDGMYLATGDMAGELFVHKYQSNGTITKVWQYSMGDMSWLFWHHASHVLFAGSDSGEIYIWRLPAGDCKILPGEGSNCEIGTLTHDGKKLISSYSNNKIKLWDIKSCTVLMEINEQQQISHQSTAITLSSDPHTPLFISGDRDGKVIFSTNNGPVAIDKVNGCVECSTFSPSAEVKLAVTGTLDGELSIWDTVKYILRVKCELPEEEAAILKVKFINNYTILASTNIGNIYAFDVRSGELLFTLTGHYTDVYDFCYNSEKKCLLTISEDSTAKIFALSHLVE